MNWCELQGYKVLTHCHIECFSKSIEVPLFYHQITPEILARTPQPKSAKRLNEEGVGRNHRIEVRPQQARSLQLILGYDTCSFWDISGYGWEMLGDFRTSLDLFWHMPLDILGGCGWSFRRGKRPGKSHGNCWKNLPPRGVLRRPGRKCYTSGCGCVWIYIYICIYIYIYVYVYIICMYEIMV